MFTTNMKDLRKLPEFASITSVIPKKDQFENKHSFIHSFRCSNLVTSLLLYLVTFTITLYGWFILYCRYIAVSNLLVNYENIICF